MTKPTIESCVSRCAVTPDDDGYEEARQVYNAIIDRRPRVVVRTRDVGDVRWPP